MDNVHSFLLFLLYLYFISMNSSELGGWGMNSDQWSELE